MLDGGAARKRTFTAGPGGVGASVFQDWLTLPGNAGKSKAEFIAAQKGADGKFQSINGFTGPNPDLDDIGALSKAGDLLETTATPSNASVRRPVVELFADVDSGLSDIPQNLHQSIKNYTCQTDLSTYLQTTIARIHNSNGGELDLTKGLYPVSHELLVPAGVSIEGRGGRVDDVAYYAPTAGTWLYLLNGASLTADQGVVRCEYQLGSTGGRDHSGRVRNLGIHGNAGNNANGKGLIIRNCVNVVAEDLIIAWCRNISFSQEGQVNGTKASRVTTAYGYSPGYQLFGGECFYTNCVATNMKAGGWLVYLNKSDFIGCYAGDCEGHGFASQDCEANTFIGGKSQDNWLAGFYSVATTSWDDHSFIGFSCINNGNKADADDKFRAGFASDVAFKRVRIQGGRYGNTRKAGDPNYPVAPAQRWGVYLTAAQALLRLDADLTGNSGGPVFGPGLQNFNFAPIGLNGVMQGPYLDADPPSTPGGLYFNRVSGLWRKCDSVNGWSNM